jgi:hypothetical protein
VTTVEPADALTEIEAIKQLKARYCRLLDTKQWAEYRELFTDGFVSDTSAAGGFRIAGADEFVAFLQRTLGRRATSHQVHNPEVTLTSETAAHGIWALHDVVGIARGTTLVGYGHYEETYLRTDRWRISTSVLTRVHEEIRTPLFTFAMPKWLHRRAARRVAKTMEPPR